MRGGGTVRRAPAETVENVLQFVAAGNDDSDADDPEIEEQAKIVEVAVEKGVLVVPLDFQRDPILETIDLVGR